MDSGWQPANQVERDMLTALQAGDSAAYARLVRAAPLYLPVLPDGGSLQLPEGLQQLFDEENVVVFTSEVSLYWLLSGLAAGHEQLNYDEVLARFPAGGGQLVINPALPIGVLLSPDEVDDVAEGRQTLMPVQDVQDTVIDGVLDEVRRMCLTELGSDIETAQAPLGDAANDLERRLARAVESLDFDEFLLALLESDVVLPVTAETTATPAAADFPWRVLGAVDSPMIPVFSSATVLDRVAPGELPRVLVPFVEVLTHWPSEEHVLCFNPGTSMELTLPGNSVPELVEALG
ncbi:SseB family protein [Amycolatopsis acidicola]|uniref:SseB family protein n=1 Tax=Amycolatopsis acidicola TaxID=2596893 RepID=A0A5N0V174_9PSEU|nr:SseB family protein [Amycolatopsis acidicola]KAA9160146.1 SseB family protein [Amycolatopsis acidicola]